MRDVLIAGAGSLGLLLLCGWLDGRDAGQMMPAVSVQIAGVLLP